MSTKSQYIEQSFGALVKCLRGDIFAKSKDQFQKLLELNLDLSQEFRDLLPTRYVSNIEKTDITRTRVKTIRLDSMGQILEYIGLNFEHERVFIENAKKLALLVYSDKKKLDLTTYTQFVLCDINSRDKFRETIGFMKLLPAYDINNYPNVISEYGLLAMHSLDYFITLSLMYYYSFRHRLRFKGPSTIEIVINGMCQLYETLTNDTCKRKEFEENLTVLENDLNSKNREQEYRFRADYRFILVYRMYMEYYMSDYIKSIEFTNHEKEEMANCILQAMQIFADYLRVEPEHLSDIEDNKQSEYVELQSAAFTEGQNGNIPYFLSIISVLVCGIRELSRQND